jgi:hypothetical protein
MFPLGNKLYHVARFRTWNQLGRFVKKGEKGIVILAPVLRRKEKENEEPAETTPAVAGFRSAYVFDITQTDDKELPAIGTVQGDQTMLGDAGNAGD